MLTEKSDISTFPEVTRMGERLYTTHPSIAATNYGTIIDIPAGTLIETLSVGENDALGAVVVARIVLRDQEVYFLL